MENEELEENIERVGVDVTINRVRYVGIALVNTETEEVDLSDFEKEGEDVLNISAYYDGNYLCKVGDILRGTALYNAGLTDNIAQCYRTDYWVDTDLLVWCNDEEYRFEELTEEWDGEYYDPNDGRTESVRTGYDDYSEEWRPDWYYEDLYWCDHCNSYVDGDDYEHDNCCRWCYEEYEEEDDDDGDYEGIIEDYCESHHHRPIFFGEYKKTFAGLGFELEVDCSYDNQCNNGETAKNLCSTCGLESNEMRFAHDGSLDHGFECISQPHTVKDFWDKQEKWRRMLSYLAENGYKSHDAGTCGLHIHVSREMFGSTEVDQDRAIAKVYAFFDENWDDIVKISRRRAFDYCDKNYVTDSDMEHFKAKNHYEVWRKKAKYSGSHYVALNNTNSATFEYRLGRGTLNAWSFFSWIDFIIVITKNACRINVEKVTSNDLLSWLGGIKESTAKYIYKRGAFRPQMLTLFPNIEWETDLTDNNN